MAAIDVGTAATNRTTYNDLKTYTVISYNNAANDTGTIDSVEAWFYVANASNSVTVATYQDNGGHNFTCIDAESVGAVASGSKQTYSGLSLEINSGNFIGAAEVNAIDVDIEASSTGYSGIYKIVGDSVTPTSSYGFTFYSGDTLSLYGTGSTGGWSNVAKVGGVASGDLAKIDGVLVADIAKINGVAV